MDYTVIISPDDRASPPVATTDEFSYDYGAHPFQPAVRSSSIHQRDRPHLGLGYTHSYGTFPIPDGAGHVSTPAASDDPPLGFDSPHWDDMMTFRQTRAKLRLSRAWSEAESVLTDHSRLLCEFEATRTDASARTWPVRLAELTNAPWKRFLLLQVMPVVVAVAWCAVPIPDDNRFRWGPSPESTPVMPTRPWSNIHSLAHGASIGPGRPAKMNFWFFLFFFYGGYNACALWLVNQFFRIYALNWWPQSMSAFTANFTTWLSTLVVGAVIYHSTLNLEKFTLTWILLTLTTLLLPVLVSLGVLRSQNRNRHRQALTEFQKIFLAESEWRTPHSYRRFLWFAVTLSITYLALLAGEYLAYLFLSSFPHRWFDGLVYVYAWVATVNILGWIAEWIIDDKIRSWPLVMVYRHYFTMIYFIFYRNLFVQLRSPDQFLLVQIGSSLWVVFIYPLRMSKRVHSFSVRWFGVVRSYEDHVKNISRTFFLRNYAENTTMLAFLASVLILHFGPNARFYPYFSFESTPDNQYTLALTLWASMAIWLSELAVSVATRWVVWLLYGHAIGKEAAKDFQRYPEMVPAMILVIIHVLQDMLFALIHLDFT
ncbi:hypothetical protein H4R34_002164 [Dimargaris verticillata]|uniref:Uncharacterized protein n=1 Tax=Dimargaris verticillata TaxID=2761393 RepID=A0A9W8B331_9FUNG|nr:hypothetical protein H4R34_002164 [Dimargaris verticillata]